MPICGKGQRTNTNTGAMSPRSALISTGSLRHLPRLSVTLLLMPSLTEHMVRLASWRLIPTPPIPSWSYRTSTTSGHQIGQELEVFLTMPRERLRLGCGLQCTEAMVPLGVNHGTSSSLQPSSCCVLLSALMQSK